MLLTHSSPGDKFSYASYAKPADEQKLHVGWMVLVVLGVSVAGMAIGFSTEAAESACIAGLRDKVLTLTSAKESLALICSQTSLITNSSFLMYTPRVFLFRYGNTTSIMKVTANEKVVEDPRKRSFFSQMIALPLFEARMLALSPDTTVPGAIALRLFCTNGLQYFGANVDVREKLQEGCHGYEIAYEAECKNAKRKPVWSQAFDEVTMCIRKRS